MFDLSGKTCVVTGANTGIGQGLALGLASAGANIVAVGRSQPEETRAQVEDTGCKFAFVEADLGDISSVPAVVEKAEAAFGLPAVLVNNAGTIKRNDALDFTEEEWDSVMDVNLKTLFFLSQGFAKRWVAAGERGKIINIASMLSYQGGIRVASYTASKSGVMGLTRLLANEWAAKKINVNAIAPGYIATNNTAALRADEKRNAEILGRIPAGRWGDPSDLSGAAIFLASTASDYVHGTTLPVDGGWLAR
ncbi:2-dehydro-3-deoxy-D-gluconate 5-dehydrogenase KduD [Parvularcula sp. LCG005]|uniref:2-dehydro-3-deoxy-D-gluconate 5-dehydrogenase KduD n=1 Tax=Parvularcula sp. LCG005 TaxID=3078805 RepID=UPI002943774C|nr:2-dehydro-3-deoxy-D-gluconate 5-dehydrogenase KduD [Parvularcula sp. LCG005]WOI52397.1 2-dehydro-3-deoxy-D-gluconate 5-dehydrogenase KduD [Parvularcula sp. LCG005]